MADSIHYIESVDDEELKVIPQEHYAHAARSLYTQGYYAYRQSDRNVLLINSLRMENGRMEF